jgi:hypothetical protein
MPAGHQRRQLLHLCGLTQRIVDAPLPSVAGRAEFIENIAVNSQGDLLLRYGRFWSAALATQLAGDELWADLIRGAHASKLRIGERWIIGIGLGSGNERSVLLLISFLEILSRPLASLRATPGDFLLTLRGQ